MQLTDPQRRVWEQLIGTGERPSFAPDLSQRLRDRIEGDVRELELAEPLWLGKEKLNDHADRPPLGPELLLCQAATAVKRSVGWSIDVNVLNTTLVMWRFSARIASVLLLPSARFFAM